MRFVLPRRHHRKKFKLAVMKEAAEKPELATPQPKGPRSMRNNIPSEPASSSASQQSSPPPPQKPQMPQRSPQKQQQNNHHQQKAGQLAEAQQLAAAGLEHYRAGRIADAVQNYQAAAKLEADEGRPINVQLIGMLAQLQDAAGQKEEAVSNYELAIHCPGAQTAPPEIIGRMKMKVGVNICSGERAAEAERYFEDALSAGVDFEFTARHAYGVALSRKVDAADDTVDRERQVQAEEQWEAAREIIRPGSGNTDSTATEEQILQFHNNVGFMYYRQGKMEKAAKEFEAAYKLQKGSSKSDRDERESEGLLRTMDLLSTIYVHLGEMDKAVKKATSALKQDSTRVMTRGNLAMMFTRQGKLKKATSAAKRAIDDAEAASDAESGRIIVPDTAYNALFLASWMQGVKTTKPQHQHIERAERALTACAGQLRKAGREHDAQGYEMRLAAWRNILAFTTAHPQLAVAVAGQHADDNDAIDLSRRARSSFDQLDKAVKLAIVNDQERLLTGDTSGKPGLFLEFGVRYGATLRQTARILKKASEASTGATDSKSYRVHGFDSFEGLPTDWAGDWGDAAGTYSTNGILPTVDTDYTELHVGWFNDTLPAFLTKETEVHGWAPVAFLHMDADLYSSTYEVLDLLCSPDQPGGSRIVPGTVIEFDEYFVLSDGGGDGDDHTSDAADADAKDGGNGSGWDQHEAKAWLEIAAKFNLAWEFHSFWTQRFSVLIL